MTHTRWKGIQPDKNVHLNEIQLAYVRGYILALEDILGDLERLLPPEPGGTANPDYYVQLGQRWGLTEVYDQVTRTLESANLTIKILQRMEGEKDHGEPREHGEVDQGPGIRET